MRRYLLALLLFFAALPAFAATAVVDWDQHYVNVRSEPSHGSKKTGAIQNGAKVEILSQKGEWAKVRHSGGEGWVVIKSLRVVAEKAPSKPPPPPVETPVAEALPVAAAPVVAPSFAPPPPPAPPESATPAGGYLSNVPDRPGLPEISIGKTLVSMISGLLLVFAIIGGVVWLLRRFLGGRFPTLQSSNAVRVLASKPLAQRQALLLVEVGGEIYFISQTESEIRLISKVDSPSAVDRLDYLFSFKPSKFESELRQELNVDEEKPQNGAAAGPGGEKETESASSIAARLAKLRGQNGKEQP